MTYCASSKLIQCWGQQEFAIPDNVLGIVYGQTICWIGAFFSPLLPAIATLKFIITFYVKEVRRGTGLTPCTDRSVALLLQICGQEPSASSMPGQWYSLGLCPQPHLSPSLAPETHRNYMSLQPRASCNITSSICVYSGKRFPITF